MVHAYVARAQTFDPFSFSPGIFNLANQQPLPDLLSHLFLYSVIFFSRFCSLCLSGNKMNDVDVFLCVYVWIALFLETHRFCDGTEGLFVL